MYSMLCAAGYISCYSPVEGCIYLGYLMKIYIFLTLIFLTSCSGIGRKDYGVFYDKGKQIETSCALIQSFDKKLRSSPRIYGEDSYVGYIDYGPGISRGHVFLILPHSNKNVSIGQILKEVDPQKRDLWMEAKMLSGNLSEEQSFEAKIPAVTKKSGEFGTIIERQAILIKGYLISACNKNYLVFVQGNPMFSESKEWENIRKRFDVFISHITWPE